MKKKVSLRYICLILSFLYLAFPLISSAVECPSGGENNGLNLCYPKFGNYTLTSGTKLNELIAWIYTFMVAISGFVAFTMLVYGGFKWLSSAGNPTAIGDAKDIIKSALLGLFIILGSWIILRVINPDLTTINMPSLDKLNSSTAPAN